MTTAAMQDAINAFIKTIQQAGDGYLQAGEWDNAVEAYKAAGNDGASHLGPAIDESTGGKSAALTHQAWTINGELNQINSGPYNGTAATKADAEKASTLVRKMYTAYHNALYPSASPKPGTWSPKVSLPTTTPEQTPKKSLLPLAGGALLGGAIGGPFGLVAVAVGALVGALAGNAIAGVMPPKGGTP